MKLLSTILLLISFAFPSTAQDLQITGVVTDSTGQPLTGAGVSLLSPVDSSLISGTTTDLKGNFIINVQRPGMKLLKFSFLGFKDMFVNSTITDKSVDLGRLTLKERSATLHEVDINEKITPTQLKGDTTQYNADAFKTTKDATAEDLVTKMPGIISQDGKVQAQGEDVKKVMIDGKPYLGDDPNAALKNLPAEVIDKIQVFDKKSDQSEFTGFDDGNTTKTMNIITRPQFRNGTFGKVFIGGGNDAQWKSGASINFFKDKRKLTLLENANNINEQNFSTDDLLGVVGTSSNNRMPGQRMTGNPNGGSGGRYQPQNDASNSLVNQKNGITTTQAAGLNYTNSWKKMDFTVSYFYNHTDNKVTNDLVRNYFTSENTGLVYKENNLGNNDNTNHRANIRLEYKFDTLNSVLFQPRISIQKNNSQNDLNGINSDNTGSLSNANILYQSNMKGLSYSSPLLYRHSFHKRGRTFSANLNSGYNQNKGNNSLNSAESFAYDSNAVSVDQISDLHSNTLTLSSELAYTEPLSKNAQLSVNYRNNYSSSSSDKITNTFSPADNSYNILDSALSNNFTSDYFSQSLGTSYQLHSEKWNLIAGLAYQVADLKNDRSFPVNDKINKSFNSILPTAMFQYRFSLRKNLRIFYRSSNNAPSVSQLQNVINNNNPLQLSTGSPDLKQDWQNNLNVRYSAVNPAKNTSFFIFISGTYTKDYIGNSTIINQGDTIFTDGIMLVKGAQLTRPVNIDGYYSLRSFGNYSFPLSFIKSTLNLNANIVYSRTPGSINGLLNYSSTTGSGLGFALSSNISDKVDFLLSSNSSFNDVKNTITKNSNSNSFSLYSKFKIQVQPWKGLVLQTDIADQHNSGLSQSYNTDYILWNAAIGYKFLKNRVAEFRLSVFDILKQNNSISRNTTDTYYEDVRSNVLQRYFMLTFTYNLKFFKVKK